MEKLRALEAELQRKYGCKVLIIQVVAFECFTIRFRFIIAMATQSLQADFTDVSVLPVIVQRLKEERVEVSICFLLHLSSILNISLVTFVINKQKKKCQTLSTL